MTITFDHLLELIDGRSAALRSALAGALDERVPGCPDWTGRDLLAHLGEVQRFWAQAVVAGKPDGPAGRRRRAGALADRRPARLVRAVDRGAARRAARRRTGPAGLGLVGADDVRPGRAPPGAGGRRARLGRGRHRRPGRVAATGGPRCRRSGRVPHGRGADQRRLAAPAGDRRAGRDRRAGPGVARRARRGRRPAGGRTGGRKRRAAAAPRAIWSSRCTVGVRWTAWPSPAMPKWPGGSWAGS